MNNVYFVYKDEEHNPNGITFETVVQLSDWLYYYTKNKQFASRVRDDCKNAKIGDIFEYDDACIIECKQKELHIHLDLHECELIENTTFVTTEKALDKGEKLAIHTTQTHFCQFDYGRRLFVHANGEVHEITLGECEGTDKEIREAHNIEKILIAGTFSWWRD